MDKGQTPITAEKFLGAQYFPVDAVIDGAKIKDLMEQYAQIKVLEALEGEFSKLDGIDFSLISGTEYYETEVKPKYISTK